MNFLERAILNLFPGWAARRAIAGYTARQFMGAELNRLRSKKTYPAYGPKAENRQNRAQLVAVARDLDRNNSFACGAFNALVNNIIGKGIDLEMRIQTAQGRLLEKVNRAVEAAWYEWSERADVSGKRCFAEIQQLVERELWVAGEVLIIRNTVRDGRQVPLGLDVIESERLAAIDGPGPAGTTGNMIVQGVEFNSAGAIVAYHIWRDYPGDSPSGADLQRIPANRVLHLFHQYRPNQVRGLSRVASVARNFEALGQFMDHELTKARIAASFALMIKRGGLNVAPKFPSSGDSADTTDAAGNPLGHIEGGMIFTGGPNDSLEGTGPSVQSQAFEQFVTVNLRAIAVGLNMSYEILARDFSRTNFSSARQSNLEDRRHWEPRQQFINYRLNDPVFRWFVDDAILALVEPFSANERRLDWEWITPPREYVNPMEEAEADILAVKAGFTNLPKVAAKHGTDVHQNILINAQIKEEAEDKGLTLAPFEEDKPEPEPEPEEAPATEEEPADAAA